MTNTINLKTQFIKNCIPFISTDEFRIYLTGIHIYKKDNMITYEATNGQILYKAHHEDIEAPDFDFILKGDFKKLKSKQPFITLDLDSMILDDSIVLKKIQADFPEVEKVIPDLSDNDIATNYVKIQSCYLEIAEKIFTMNYELLQGEKNTPCMIKEKNELMVIMPFRCK